MAKSGQKRPKTTKDHQKTKKAARNSQKEKAKADQRWQKCGKKNGLKVAKNRQKQSETATANCGQRLGKVAKRGQSRQKWSRLPKATGAAS